MTIKPLLRGRIDYMDATSRACWGFEEWTIGTDGEGARTLRAHCEMAVGGEEIVRDSVQSVAADFHPIDAFVRIQREGRFTGSGWFRFTDSEAECEAWSVDGGRISERAAIQRPMRGFGTHVLVADGWMAATFPYHLGPGHSHSWGENLIHSTHHLGATGPMLAKTGSGLEFVGDETVDVPAGTFECHRLRFVGFTNDHPPYDFWVTNDGDFLFVRGEVGGYLNGLFELTRLSHS
jgi:hypothetical protein